MDPTATRADARPPEGLDPVAWEHRLRCRAFVLRAKGRWSPEARARLETQLAERRLTGDTDAVLAELVVERQEDAVYLCTGSSCTRLPLLSTADQPAAEDLPVRQSACLGACRQAPSAHRVQDGVGHTHARLDEALLQDLLSGEDTEPLRLRRWRAGEDFVEPELAALLPFLGAWVGEGGFTTPGCVRRLDAAVVLGGRFVELTLENAWPTVVDSVDRYPERFTLQPAEGGGLTGVYLDYRGLSRVVDATCEEGVLDVVFDGDTGRRRRFVCTGDTLTEAHQRQHGETWTAGFCATLARLPAS